jgi:hypothetical protein
MYDFHRETLSMTGVQLVNGVLTAVGTITGNVPTPTGDVVGSTTQAVSAPVQVSASCEILNLVLGPLDLNLLGLVVHLDQVVLNTSPRSRAPAICSAIFCVPSPTC